MLLLELQSPPIIQPNSMCVLLHICLFVCLLFIVVVVDKKMVNTLVHTQSIHQIVHGISFLSFNANNQKTIFHHSTLTPQRPGLLASFHPARLGGCAN